MNPDYSDPKHLELLRDYYRYNKKFYNELAEYYKNLPTFYEKYFVPIEAGLEPVLPICPFCKNQITPIENKRLSVIGMILLIATCT